MAGLTITFRGLEVLVERLDLFEQYLREEAVNALHSSGAHMRAVAAENAAVDTGWMRAHIREDYADELLAATVGMHEEDFVGQVNYRGKPITFLYPIVIEYGSVKQSAQPFLGPAAAETEQTFEDAVKQAVIRALERAAGAV